MMPWYLRRAIMYPLIIGTVFALGIGIPLLLQASR